MEKAKIISCIECRQAKEPKTPRSLLCTDCFENLLKKKIEAE